MYFDELSKLKRNEPSCKEFKFPNKNIDDRKAKDIFQALSANTFCLKVILTDNSITDSSLSQICETLQKNKTIESLELEGNQFTSKGIDDFLKGLSKNTSLTDVTISENATDQQLDEVDDILDRNFEEKKKKKSQPVKVEPVKEEPKTPTKVEPKTPTKVEVKTPKVEPKVESKPLSVSKPLEFEEIQKLKKNDAFLKEVNLSKKKIDDSIAKELFQALNKNTVCSRVLLKDNLLSDACVVSICDTLQQNSTIQFLDLEGNSFTSFGIDHFIKGMDKNYSLKDVKISNASTNQWDKIDDILDRNFDYKPSSSKPVSKDSTPTTKDSVQKDSPKLKIDPKVYEPVKGPSTPTTPSLKKEKEIVVEKNEGESRRRVMKVRKGSVSPNVETIKKEPRSPDPEAMEKYLREVKEMEDKKEQLKKKLDDLERLKKEEEKKAREQNKDFKPLEFSREEIEKTMRDLAIADENEKKKKW